ncbi:hypothetical protein MTO96_029316, partial [Rhipicephalus appendiculatus]
VCGKQFSASSNLKAHAVVHTGERRFRCAECGKAFATSSHLKTHTIVHSGRRPYQCEICLREFSVSSNLRSHMFVCGKQFSSSSHVKTHMLTHSGERPHKCDMCPKSFAVVSNLKAHRKIHLGQKDHACDVCGKLFYTSSDMKSPPCITSAIAATPDASNDAGGDGTPSTENAVPDSPHPKANGFSVDTKDFAGNPRKGLQGPQDCDAAPANRLQADAGSPVVANGCRATSKSGRVASPNPSTPRAAGPFGVASAGSDGVRTKEGGDNDTSTSRVAAAVKGEAFGAAVPQSAQARASPDGARARNRVSRGV